MEQQFDPKQNFEETRKAIGYVDRRNATQADYDRIGFMSGLEVHQQLNTAQKLFCRCPAGKFQKPDQFDAELIRHMRPTLSELGEYDGTALMEFRTRKEIVYRIANETACTYDVDDTPPFPLNRQALEQALEISLLSKLKIVGEVHITRKQYLDGSIPTGFQRTAIIGVEGEIQMKNKKVRLIQLSLEEDSCREVSDIGHVRVYRTDRLGMPLIETVTYPDFTNPDEVKEGADYIRFLNRSTGKVRQGIGSTRADVNVSCRGGTRVEIKGVAHTSWMPELTHNEAFRQWALLRIKELLAKSVPDQAAWKLNSKEVSAREVKIVLPQYHKANKTTKIVAVNLPKFRGILSHFTQPGHMFSDEITNRLKVIACIEKPNMVHSEMIENPVDPKVWDKVRSLLGCKPEDAQIIFWGPADDVKTAIETIDERCRMAMNGVPNETRKSFDDGTTIFERVLPGADRMYPDTDSAPIPLAEEVIDNLRKNMPMDISERYAQLRAWNIPADTCTFILKNNLVPLIEKCETGLKMNPKFTATLLGHRLKHLVNKQGGFPEFFNFEQVFQLLKFIREKGLDPAIAPKMLAELFNHPKMDFESVLVTIGFKATPKEEILGKVPFLVKKYRETSTSKREGAGNRWIMGSLHKTALGNISLKELNTSISI
jgi:glutamyl-tRNA(Gln) amidotransferase subunit E